MHTRVNVKIHPYIFENFRVAGSHQASYSPNVVGERTPRKVSCPAGPGDAQGSSRAQRPENGALETTERISSNGTDLFQRNGDDKEVGTQRGRCI